MTKFERHIDGAGKYALLRNRDLSTLEGEARVKALAAVATLRDLGLLDFGEEGTGDEFFVMRLKDAYAGSPLTEYAANAERDGQTEYSAGVMALAGRAGSRSRFCKRPD